MCNYYTWHTTEHGSFSKLGYQWRESWHLFESPMIPPMFLQMFLTGSSLVLESESSFPKRELESLHHSLSFSLWLIKALPGWRFHPENSYHYELPVALWTAPTTDCTTPGDLIWPKESRYIWIISPISPTSTAFKYSLCSCSLFALPIRGWTSFGISGYCKRFSVNISLLMMSY